MKTLCCNYEPAPGSPSPIMWNEYNRVIQCHNCGEIWKPVSQLRKMISQSGLLDELRKEADINAVCGSPEFTRMLRDAVAVIESLQLEIHMLKESRAACVAQEQINRNEANRLRGELANFMKPSTSDTPRVRGMNYEWDSDNPACVGCGEPLYLKPEHEWADDDSLNLCHECALGAVETMSKLLRRVLDWCEQESPDFELDADTIRRTLLLPKEKTEP